MTLLCRPELATKPTMKAENIKIFGEIMHDILDAYEEGLTKANSPQK